MPFDQFKIQFHNSYSDWFTESALDCSRDLIGCSVRYYANLQPINDLQIDDVTRAATRIFAMSQYCSLQPAVFCTTPVLIVVLLPVHDPLVHVSFDPVPLIPTFWFSLVVVARVLVAVELDLRVVVGVVVVDVVVVGVVVATVLVTRPGGQALTIW